MTHFKQSRESRVSLLSQLNTNHLNSLIKKIRGSNVEKYTTTSRKMLGKPKLDSTTGMISDTSNSILDLKGKFSVNFTDRQFEL